MSGSIAPVVKHQFFDNNGDPLAGGLLFTYSPGTSTKLTTYSDVDLSVANTNPIVLDSAGRATIFLSPTSYKFVLCPATDTDPPTSPLWTVDSVSSVPTSSNNVDSSGTAGEALSANEAVYLADGSGATTAGYWYKTDASATATSTTVKQFGFVTADIASGGTVTVRIAGRMTGFTGLSTGSVYYISETAGEITAVAPTYAQKVAVADSAQSVLLLPLMNSSTFPATLPALNGSNLTHITGANLDGDIPDAATPTYVDTHIGKAKLISRGGTLVVSTGILAGANIIVWPYADVTCTVTAIKGYRVGGTGATVNARKNGTDNFLASALSLTSADTTMDGGAVQNTAITAGDKVEIMIVTVAGSPTQVGVQIMFNTTV